MKNIRSIILLIAIATGFALATSPAGAVPSFAVQTGQPCSSCHVGGFGPQLTPYGRQFKLEGYTMRVTKFNLPVSAMVVASYTNTKKNQDPPPAPGYGTNNFLTIDQISIFLAGGVGQHFGGFVQTTYDAVGKNFTWDNLDLRAVTHADIKGTDVIFGLSLNNNPTVQDAWNTTPAWGYPFTSSALAPTPAASPLLSGGLAQGVLGVTAYAWINSKFFIEGGAYSSPKAGTLSALGADPLSPGDIKGLAPYGRIAFQQLIGGGTFEVGAFGLRAAIHPGRDRTVDATDRYTDYGLDGSYIKDVSAGNTLAINTRLTHEEQNFVASCALLGVSDGCAKNTLTDVRADVSYYWHQKFGATLGGFYTNGSTNEFQYSGNRTFSPNSSGLTVQFDASPLAGLSKTPLNLRVGIQYTAYLKFNGAKDNYDGAGANASDNNTVRVFTWIAF